MELTEDTTSGHNIIHSYKAGEIIVNEQAFHESIILTPDQLMPWHLRTPQEINQQNLDILLQLKPSIILLGMGPTQLFLPSNLLQHFIEQSIGVEMMTTAAACRTFNILVAEGRNVAAGLLV